VTRPPGWRASEAELKKQAAVAKLMDAAAFNLQVDRSEDVAKLLDDDQLETLKTAGHFRSGDSIQGILAPGQNGDRAARRHDSV
jgi:hypothetical protein